jgi:nucleoside-diphosphate-sugar epimerase
VSERFTIVGSSGFIGRHLVAQLKNSGHEVVAINRIAESQDDNTNYGHVIDCGGLTADFRTRRTEIFEAHASRIDRAVQRLRFVSYLYLSSTRVYKNSPNTSEDSPIEVRPAEFDDSYNISKIAGESICLLQANPKVRVARLSNVMGPNPDRSVFLTSIITDAALKGRIVFGESLSSAKDYIDIDDVCRYLEGIAVSGQQRLYNVAYGQNRTHSQLLEQIGRRIKFSVAAPDAPVRAFPVVSVSRLQAEFGSPRVAAELALDKAVEFFTNQCAQFPAATETP